MVGSLGMGGTTNRTAFRNHLMNIHTQAEKKKKVIVSKLSSQIPLAAHGLTHSLCNKPQGNEYNAVSCTYHIPKDLAQFQLRQTTS